MPFVKIDCGILDSTLWMDRDARECFVTALLMAQPREFTSSIAQIEVESLNDTGFVAPPGWYGFVPAAGVAIIRRAGILDQKAGFQALSRLGSPEMESRSPEFEGRRLIRIDGGYLVLNFMKYRDRDYTGAERARRYRDRQKVAPSHRDDATSHRDTPVTSRMQSAECRVQKEGDKSAGAKDAPLVLHASLPQESWSEWLAHRREKRLSMSPRALNKQLKLLAEYPTAIQREIIDTSINAGWEGLFKPKGRVEKPQGKSEWM
jgi:hypothetical protein